MSDRPVDLLRQWMKSHEVKALLIPIADPHASEYIAPHWQYLRYLTGFTGSAATAIVTLNEALMWTDSRYWLQAAEELEQLGFFLMKEGEAQVPSPLQWCAAQDIMTLHAPHDMVTVSLREEAESAGLELEGISTACLLSEVWPQRPPLPCEPIKVQDMQWAGIAISDKLQRLTTHLRQAGVKGYYLINDLADIAWLLNLRGSDIEYNPVFIAWLAINVEEGSYTLFTHAETLMPEAALQLGQCQVKLRAYNELAMWEYLHSCSYDRTTAPLMLDDGNARRHFPNPVSLWRAKKCKAECEGLREAMLRDGVALVQFMRWMNDMRCAGTLPTEMELDQKLTALRAEQSGFEQLSFATIAGYGPHGAIVHYEASDSTDSQLEPHGLLLLDSGAQYDCGTTDITRTLALGTLTEEERRVCTLVLKGHLALQRQHFPQGTTGIQLDLAARQYMWNEGYDFGHGTGHGVGAHLCVHEGPYQIRKNLRTCTLLPLLEGYTVTDEPGIYVEGHFGVRIENTLLTVEAESTAFGKFLQFEVLTLCPYDVEPIDLKALTSVEIEQINAYHAMLRQLIMPRLYHEADRQWLKQATTPI